MLASRVGGGHHEINRLCRCWPASLRRSRPMRSRCTWATTTWRRRKTPMILDGYGSGGFPITTANPQGAGLSSTTACSSPTPLPTRRRSRRWRKRSGSIRNAPCACGARPGRPGRRSTSARAKMKSRKLAELADKAADLAKAQRHRPRASADPRAAAALQEWRRRQGRRPQFRQGDGGAREPISRRRRDRGAWPRTPG